MTEGQTDRPTNRQTDGGTDSRREGQTGRWTEVRTDGKMDGSDFIGQCSTNVQRPKIREVENKIPDVSKLIKKADSDVKQKTMTENISLPLIIKNLPVTYLIQT